MSSPHSFVVISSVSDDINMYTGKGRIITNYIINVFYDKENFSCRYSKNAELFSYFKIIEQWDIAPLSYATLEWIANWTLELSQEDVNTIWYKYLSQ